MLKSMILAIPIFSMMFLKILSKVIKVISQKMRKFFWNGAREQDKFSLLAWESICREKGEGGAELHD